MIKEFAKGLWITFKHLLPGNSTTVQYPKQKLPVADRFRGLHRLVPAHDREKCVACYLCPTVCPAKCITVESGENEKGEKYPVVYEIDMLRCIFCGYCEDACPTQAIELGHEHELSFTNRKDAIFTKNMLIDAVPPGGSDTPQEVEPGKYTRSIPDMPNPA